MTAQEHIEGIEVIRLAETGSTNDVARALAEERRSRTPLLITARHQRAGRGRGTNRWHSAAGDDLLFSLLWYPSRLPVAQQFALSMAAALATARLISTFTGNVSVKWPNDILVAGRKIAGILIETTISRGLTDTAVIGAGINVNGTDFPPSLPTAISLRMVTGKRHDTGELLTTITGLLRDYLQKAEKGGVEALQEEYESILYGRGEESSFRTEKGEITAIIQGIDPWGRLLLTLPDGTTHPFGMEEVHQQL